MPFKRDWDANCPKVWETWRSPDGAEWTIQDLPPEDDHEAVDMLLLTDFMKDEILCGRMGVGSHPESAASARAQFKQALSFRTSIACYRLKDGERRLVAVNACPVCCADDPKGVDTSLRCGAVKLHGGRCRTVEMCPRRKTRAPEILQGERWKTIVDILDYTNAKGNIYETLGIDKYLGGAGLLVLREFRGNGLGARILNAREKLCKDLGLPATVTVFSGDASQKSAARCGFQTLVEVTFAELHQTGFPYDENDGSCLKLMAKSYL